jgi:antitoxin ParD1/3/4
MAQINFSLPDNMKVQIEAVVAQGRYSSASDYLRDLVRRDEQRLEQLAELQAMIESGIASGIDPRDPADVIEAIIARHAANA